jgi:cell division protein FtsL
VFASILVGAMVLGLTTLNAVLAQGSFHIADLTKRVDKLQQDFERKQLEVAELTSPGRIAARAAALGMVLPEPKQVKVVHMSGPASRDGRGGHHPAGPGNAG